MAAARPPPGLPPPPSCPRQVPRRRRLDYLTCTVLWPPGAVPHTCIFLRPNCRCAACHSIARYTLPASTWLATDLLQQIPQTFHGHSMAQAYPPDPRIHGLDLQLNWKTLAEDGPRPLPLLLKHADFTLSCQHWIHESNTCMDYTLPSSPPLVLTTHTYRLRRLITIASAYGGVATHAFLLSRDIVQQATVDYSSISLAGFELWSSLPWTALRTLDSLPTQSPIHPLFYHTDSSVHVSSHSHLIPTDRFDVWARLEEGCTITAPLPLWTRHYVTPSLQWLWPY
ncbi:hypothetical protein C0J50_5551 [Silurus asotus]|uniref:Uncharacterized protein n=1 Tax=Silurus asotus TaxID=30991 RepID=A0AAD5FBR6_SILAS|nr:hypothetical protein C0J50_5551 [Silurus asotus]